MDDIRFTMCCSLYDKAFSVFSHVSGYGRCGLFLMLVEEVVAQVVQGVKLFIEGHEVLVVKLALQFIAVAVKFRPHCVNQFA